MNTMQENMKFGKERLENQNRFITEREKGEKIFREILSAERKKKEKDIEQFLPPALAATHINNDLKAEAE